MNFKKRKWGWYLTLIDMDKFKVKILRFKKGKSCSYQRHKYRDELWCVLSGEGNMRTEWCNVGSSVTFKKGNFFNVMKTQWHEFTAFKNSLILEIQTGTICIEEDIERR